MGVGLLAGYVGYWFLYAASPAFESDDIAMIAGVEQMLRGWIEPRNYMYRYENQPLYYWLLFAAAKVFRLPVAFLSLCFSALSLTVILIVFFMLVRRFCSLRSAVYAVLSAVLIQELIKSGIHPNTSIVALAFAMCSFSLACRFPGMTGTAVAAVVAVMAVLIRNDMVLLLPAFFAYLIFRRRYADTVLLSVVFITGFLFLAHVMDTPLRAILRSTGQHFAYYAQESTGISRLWMIMTAAPVGIMGLAILGGIWLFRRRYWSVLVLNGIAVLPVVGFYWPALTSATYFLYVAPFLAWFAAQGWELLSQKKPAGLFRLIQTAVVGVLVVQCSTACRWLPLAQTKVHYEQGWWYMLASDGPQPLTNIFLAPHWYAVRNRKILSIAETVQTVEQGKNRVFVVNSITATILMHRFVRQSIDFLSGEHVPHNWRHLQRPIYFLPDGTKAAVFDSCADDLPSPGTEVPEYVTIRMGFGWEPKITVEYPPQRGELSAQKATWTIPDQSGVFTDRFLWDYFR